MAEIKPSGSIDQHFKAHMDAYWKWIDSGQAIADVEHKRKTLTGPALEENRSAFKTMAFILSMLARTNQGKTGTPITNEVGPPVANLLSNYVHDSIEHFSLTGGTLQTDITNANYYHLRKINQPS
jgi:hypothetical protein